MDLKLAYDSDADLVYRQRLEESLAAYSLLCSPKIGGTERSFFRSHSL